MSVLNKIITICFFYIIAFLPCGYGMENATFKYNELTVVNSPMFDADVLTEIARTDVKKLTLIRCDNLEGSFDLSTLSFLQELDLINCKGVRNIPILPAHIKKMNLTGCFAISLGEIFNGTFPDSLKTIKSPTGEIFYKEIQERFLPNGEGMIFSVRWKIIPKVKVA